jgi:hypothetical protein
MSLIGCGDPSTDYVAWIRHEFRQLADRAAEAVEQNLRQLLAAAGFDPDDRSDGWEDRARVAFAGTEVDTTFDSTVAGQLTVVTTVRHRR